MNITTTRHDSGRVSSGSILRWALSPRSEEHTSELQSQSNLVCRLLLEKKKHSNLSPSIASPGAGDLACLIVRRLVLLRLWSAILIALRTLYLTSFAAEEAETAPHRQPS